MSKSFFKALLKLSAEARADVHRTIDKLDAGNNSTHEHQLKGVPFSSVCTNRNALRLIFQQEGDARVFLHVDSHDAAYEWAKRHKLVQAGQKLRLVAVSSSPGEASSSGTPEQPGIVRPPGPLSAFKAKALRHLGVRLPTALILQGLDDEPFYDLVGHFPLPRMEALFALYCDPSEAVLQASIETYREAMAQLDAAAITSAMAPQTLAQVLADPANAAQFALAPGEAQLEAALQAGFGEWQIFLHPSQRKLARWRVNGPIKVTGGPGTGKTVVALHRARYLVETIFVDDPRPVLLTTFSRSLAKQIQRGVDQLCADVPGLSSRIEVLTLTQVARRLLRAAELSDTLCIGTEAQQCWIEAMKAESLGRSLGFYVAEREHVLERMGAWTLPVYLKTVRSGRGSRLPRAQRRAVWKVLAGFEEALQTRRGGDEIALAREATLAVSTGRAAALWSAVVCDEVQDAGASQLRLLAALTRGESGTIEADRLFLCGDGYQRLYRAPVKLSACGINTQGRSRRLKLNYRTTEGIRRAAVAHAQGLELDELDRDDGRADTAAALSGYRSLRGGPAPERPPAFSSIVEEAAFIVEISKRSTDALLILARTSAYLDDLEIELEGHGVNARRLGESDAELQIGDVALTTLHRSKGLEAPRVLIAGAQLVPAKYQGTGDSADKAHWLRREACLLYVGMTRARDWCAVTRVERT